MRVRTLIPRSHASQFVTLLLSSSHNHRLNHNDAPYHHVAHKQPLPPPTIKPRQLPAKQTRQPHKRDDHTATSPTSTTTPAPYKSPACHVTRCTPPQTTPAAHHDDNHDRQTTASAQHTTTQRPTATAQHNGSHANGPRTTNDPMGERDDVAHQTPTSAGRRR